MASEVEHRSGYSSRPVHLFIPVAYYVTGTNSIALYVVQLNPWETFIARRLRLSQFGLRLLRN